jgi:hypothetical protein
MDADERRRMEAAMAKISREKKIVEADPAAAMQESLDAAMTKAKRRLFLILFLVALGAAALAIFLRSR